MVGAIVFIVAIVIILVLLIAAWVDNSNWLDDHFNK